MWSFAVEEKQFSRVWKKHFWSKLCFYYRSNSLLYYHWQLPQGLLPSITVCTFVRYNRLFQNLLVHYTNIVILLSVRCSICKLLVPFERSGVDPSSCNSVGHRLLTNYVCVCNISFFKMLTVRHTLFTKQNWSYCNFLMCAPFNLDL